MAVPTWTDPYVSPVLTLHIWNYLVLTYNLEFSRLAIASGIHSYFHNAMTKVMINKNRTHALETDVNFFFV